MPLNEKALVTSIVQFDKTDPLWDEVPEMGVEGLIATVDDEKELKQKLAEVGRDRKQPMRSLIQCAAYRINKPS